MVGHADEDAFATLLNLNDCSWLDSIANNVGHGAVIRGQGIVGGVARCDLID